MRPLLTRNLPAHISQAVSRSLARDLRSLAGCVNVRLNSHAVPLPETEPAPRILITGDLFIWMLNLGPVFS